MSRSAPRDREARDLAEANLRLEQKLRVVTKERDNARKVGARAESDYKDQSVEMERLRQSHRAELVDQEAMRLVELEKLAVDLMAEVSAREDDIQIYVVPEVGLREERERADGVEIQKAEAKPRVQRDARDRARSLKAREVGSATSVVNMADMDLLQSEHNCLQRRYDALVTGYPGRESALSPLDVGIAQKRYLDCSWPSGDLIVPGEGPCKDWRIFVLNEANASLVMLYRQVEKLESDRKKVVESIERS